MIPKDTIDKIIDAARVEEVIGDFITLKKRGANLLGLCPFHGEKTPSFTVSPSKGIYKCFGCGKAGNAVNFIMDLEKLSYPEALKYLARKYGIEVVEKEITPEERAVQNEKESLYIVAQYAQKYFSDLLLNDDLGRSIGLGYFYERGFTNAIIEKFQLGYSSEERRRFSETAVKNGYKPEYLVKTGLSILSNNHVEGQPIKVSDIFDRYTGRVIFPIHNLSGRVIGFGGRILTSDKKQAKYINSPQTDIYDKSKVLYGLYQAKKTIVEKDTCYLVEGYTDVLSMHQSGIENVVASSGTSLTVEQIKLIHRFTKNIVILYDGDYAGIKASFRGIDLILEEGMNVRVLLFPDGDDPDSYSKKVSNEAFQEFIKNNSRDFISFKTNLLYEDAKNDPIRRADLIKDIVESISVIPDAINRSVYVKECSRIMDISEQVLQQEINKILRKRGEKGKGPAREETQNSAAEITLAPELEETLEAVTTEIVSEHKELELLRLMMQYGNILIEIEAEDGEKEHHMFELSVCEYIIFELWRDNIQFQNPIYQMVFEEFQHELAEERLPPAKHFLNHPNPAISKVAVDISSFNDTLSDKWLHYGVYVIDEKYQLKKAVQHAVFSLKETRVMGMIQEEQELLRQPLSDDELEAVLKRLKFYNDLKVRVNKLLGRTVTR
ncbi:MAG: DNA primase [Bacteroidetes bacterium]|nr:DNA primase [Bacteroidota bacterium]